MKAQHYWTVKWRYDRAQHAYIIYAESRHNSLSPSLPLVLPLVESRQSEHLVGMIAGCLQKAARMVEEQAKEMLYGA